MFDVCEFSSNGIRMFVNGIRVLRIWDSCALRFASIVFPTVCATSVSAVSDHLVIWSVIVNQTVEFVEFYTFVNKKSACYYRSIRSE